jgi:uncharacterized integral membrane protein
MSTEDRPAEESPDAATEASTAADPERTRHTADPLRGSRAGATWVALVGVGVLLVLLVIFILQNTQSVQVSYLGFDGRAPLAVCLIVAAAAGILLTALAGTLRILQLRHRVRRETRRARR